MKTIKKRRVPARVDSYAEYTCDRCGKEPGEDVDVETSASDSCETAVSTTISVRRVERYRYESTGTTIATTVDCCEQCFREHVLPALVALGFKPRTEESDW